MNKKRIIAYAIIITVLIPFWICWGGFKNDFATLIIMIVGVFAGVVYESETNKNVKAE